MADELDVYRDMLLGRQPLPVDNGVMSLMESATAMYSRGQEIASAILRGEREGHIAAKSNLYKFRTGELRSFLEMCSKQIELGSRRVTAAKMEYEQMVEGHSLDGF